MTSLAVALSVDARGPCAMYIITDSRITYTWNTTIIGKWDAGQKTFAPTNFPDIFGFCGDAHFPPSAIRQMIDLVNNNILFHPSDSAKCRHRIAIDVIRSVIERTTDAPPITNFAILHGSRDGEFMTSKFRVWKTQYFSKTDHWKDKELEVAEGTSYLAHLDGSGSATVSKFNKDFQESCAGGTSRAAISAFCRALHSGNDAYSGGPPQLVGMWRKGVAKHFGFIWCGKRYLCGVEVPPDSHFSNVNWFNQRFERYDGEKIKRLPNARVHAKPDLGY
ncbi:MAG: hypothetical protein OXF88_20870 [Rhodobacteraceae bacterium]|nr:hypothetical protein [Paracoccaceae bacterium]